MIDRLIESIKKTGAPIVVGLDPTLKLIPPQITEKYYKEMGKTPEAVAEASVEYNKGLTDAICDVVPAVKPQIAMYEAFGIPGLIAFDRTVKYCKEKGLIVIGDVKRGDIGSTSEAYAQAHLGHVTIGDQRFAAFDGDFAMVNP